MKYLLTFYTDNFIPEGAAGCARGPFIFIHKKYKDDYGLYKHELEHIKQGFLGLFIIHNLLYLLVPSYRLWAEVAAYKEQAKHYQDDRIPLFAAFIAEHYNLKITQQEAEKLLRRF